MNLRRPPTALIAVAAGSVCALVLAGSAPAAVETAPDLASMALTAADLPAGAKVTKQGYIETQAVAGYQRTIVLRGARVGGSRLEEIINILFLDETTDEAAAELARLRGMLATPTGRTELKQVFSSGVGDLPRFKPFVVTIGLPRPVALADGGVSVRVRLLGKKKQSLDIVLTFVRVGRVIGLVSFFSVERGHVAPVDADRVTVRNVERMRAALMPVSLGPPTVGGTLRAGEAAVADPGQWHGDELAFEYQWLRCDGDGGQCVPLAGETSPAYELSLADAGATLRVSVTGSNGLGKVNAVSPASATVAAAQPAGS
jgi:hypothetical protein